MASNDEIQLFMDSPLYEISDESLDYLKTLATQGRSMEWVPRIVTVRWNEDDSEECEDTWSIHGYDDEWTPPRMDHPMRYIHV